MMGIKTIGDLSKIPPEALRKKFGESMGSFMHEMSCGIDNRSVIPFHDAKSIGREITFSRDIDDINAIKSILLFLSQKISVNLYSKGYKGKTVTIKIRFSDFKTITRRSSISQHTSAIFDIYKSSLKLFKNVDLLRKKIRLIGVYVSGLEKSCILDNVLIKEERKDEKLTAALKKIAEKFGNNKMFVAGIKEISG